MKGKLIKHSDNNWYKVVVECECGETLVIPISECLLAAPDGRRVCLRKDEIDLENDEDKDCY